MNETQRMNEKGLSLEESLKKIKSGVDNVNNGAGILFSIASITLGLSIAASVNSCENNLLLRELKKSQNQQQNYSGANQTNTRGAYK